MRWAANSVVILCSFLSLASAEAQSSLVECNMRHEWFGRDEISYVDEGLNWDEIFDDECVIDLVQSALSADHERVDLLISQGVDVNYLGTRRLTPLYFTQHNYDAFKLLLERGADSQINLRSEDSGLSVFSMSIKSLPRQYLLLLLEHNADVNFPVGGLQNSAVNLLISGNIRSLRNSDNEGAVRINMLLNFGADINMAGVLGATPFLSAIAIRNYSLAGELVTLGADACQRYTRDYGFWDIVSNDLGNGYWRSGVSDTWNLDNTAKLYRFAEWIDENTDCKAPEDLPNYHPEEFFEQAESHRKPWWPEVIGEWRDE